MMINYKEDIRYYYITMYENGLFVTSSTYGISKEIFFNHFPNIYEDEEDCDNAVFKLNVFFTKHVVT